ncbi:MAG: YdcF family protein [Deltaproteobacteria bacterium]|nr:YdcF family protein [Deltaproteobacteria bacterium]
MRGILSTLVRVLGGTISSSDPNALADVIVVLGCPLASHGGLSRVAEERVRAGVELWRRGLAPVVCLTGGVSRRGLPSEAEVMGQRARELGVPDEALLMEVEALCTQGNAEFVARISASRGWRKAWIVTQPFHLRRALFWFRLVGMEPLGWHVQDSIQYREPWLGLKWMVREHVAWLRLIAGSATRRDGAKVW